MAVTGTAVKLLSTIKNRIPSSTRRSAICPVYNCRLKCALKHLPLTLRGILNQCHLHDPRGMTRTDDTNDTLPVQRFSFLHLCQRYMLLRILNSLQINAPEVVCSGFFVRRPKRRQAFCLRGRICLVKKTNSTGSGVQRTPIFALVGRAAAIAAQGTDGGGVGEGSAVQARGSC
jgi:hypothetical protein